LTISEERKKRVIDLYYNQGKTTREIAKIERMSIRDIHKLPYMESLYGQIKDEVDKLQYTRQALVNDIETRKYKISILDKIAFSSEQECKRTEQRVRELADKKDRLQKLIANILNGEDYSKLRQIVKENVKVVLSENKELISVSFAAIIQTLKTDPKMVYLIYNMPTDNDGKQHEDNNNHITKYLESNKDSILNLGEKNYQNLVQALTNNAISTAAAPSSSNPTFSLSSSTLPSPYNQNDTNRIEEP
jgi:hypothetical protein